jgi:death on curing protein
MTYYLNIVQLIIINEQLVGERSRLRDVDLLEAAVLRPQTSAFGEDAYPRMIDKAAALFHSLARNHAFVDGNKRTATIAMILFLRKNGVEVRWDALRALDFILDAAQGKFDVQDIADWLMQNTAAVEPIA